MCQPKSARRYYVKRYGGVTAGAGLEVRLH